MPEKVLPGTYVEVRAEGLITAGSVATGNIGVVGTADKGPIHEVVLLSSLADAKEALVESSEDTDLMKALKLIYANGGRSVYAVRAGGTKSQVELTVTETIDGKKSTKPALILRAKEPGEAGNNLRVKIEKEQEDPDKSKITIEKEEKTAKNKSKTWTPIEDYEVESLIDFFRKIEDAENSKIEAIELDQALRGNLPDETQGDGKSFTRGTGPEPPNYEAALTALQQEPVNIVVVAGATTQQPGDMQKLLEGHLQTTAGIKRERIGIIDVGFDAQGQDSLPGDVPDNGRLILVAPGIRITKNKVQESVSGYTSAAVAGLLASLPVQASPTNKPLVLEGLSTAFNNADLKSYVQKRILTIEKRNGFRVVKGITTNSGAWKQITTRRIVDYAIYGVRSGCDPYIGKLNNARVRGAMKATLDGFLTRMVENEALVSYSLEVTATRADEKLGIANVTMTLQPTFSIDFIQVTMYLD